MVKMNWIGVPFWTAITAIGTVGGVFYGKHTEHLKVNVSDSYNNYNISLLGDGISETVEKHSPEKQRLAEALIAAFSPPEHKGSDADLSKEIGRKIGAIINKTSISKFQIPDNEFTLKVGEASSVRHGSCCRL